MIDTRDRILAAAGELFARQGSQNTSVREIAEALGLTKTAVLYHFRTKADILATLAQPLIDDTDAAVERVAREGGGGWGTVETLLEVYLRHRDVLSTIVANMPALPREAFERWFTVMNRANEMVAGPDPDLSGRVRAIQVVALLSDPVILLADVPTDELRHHILNGARRLLTDPPDLPTPSGLPGTTRTRVDESTPGGESPSAGVEQSSAGKERPGAGGERVSAGGEGPSVGARALGDGERPSARERRSAAGKERPGAGGERASGGKKGSAGGGRRAGVGRGGALGGGDAGSEGVLGGGGSRVGGRPRSMSDEMIAEARRLRENGDTTVSEVAQILGVSRATLYRHL
ncbi:TetR family transcriptional regulator [Nonomuraea endophytica]|uniref:AcrR family transcriptional regulator n=1 Tax=Nonomuraea endophytica TaxID=714136 RepID=A0A7W7ZZ55_9ACTN|nr:TetR family transcriptional regulator [Nonomuraea endophytica]MBB5076513.1 AcrR family transcriptional regulator [Nonomuraea endophytica]